MQRNRKSRGKRKRRKKNGKTGRTVAVLLAVFLILSAACAGIVYFLSIQGRQDTDSFGVSDYSVNLDELYSPFAVLIDEKDGDLIGEKQCDMRIYPASMTKILSVFVAIESIRNLDKSVTFSADIFDDLYEQDASRAGFEPGETTTVRDLLYGALLPSGAECCIQLAIEAAGSEEGLVEKMNKKVENLGLKDSHFTNCTGLHDEDQYTTACEMAMILKAALENDTFRTVFTTHYHVMEPTNLHPDGFTVWSTFFKSVENEDVTGGKILGAKTGYTEEAGLCMASMAEICGQDYILVTAGWTDEEDISNYHFTDAFTAYDLLGEELLGS